MTHAAGQYVFGYASLAAARRGVPARLEGYRRVWGVAMDNRVDVPGYKSYRRFSDDSRPDVHVAFLDIVEQPGGAIEGLLLGVDDVSLLALDERERNYDRIDVTAAVPEAPGRIWTYRGSDQGRRRLRAGLRDNRAVVDVEYVRAVRATFIALGVDDDPAPGAELPLMSLRRVDLPPARDQVS